MFFTLKKYSLFSSFLPVLVAGYVPNSAYSYKNGMDYVGETAYQAKECCWYMHKLSDKINALISNGLEIEKMDEYNMEMANNESIKNMETIPLSYIIKCRRL